MNPIEFIKSMEGEYKPLEREQYRRWQAKLSEFTDEQLEKIYDRMMENAGRYQPRYGSLLTAAKELGYMNRESDSAPSFRFDREGDHELCGGIGLLKVYFDVMANAEGKRDKRLLAVRPANYVERIHLDDKDRPVPEFKGEGIVYDFLYRCPCAAGERQPKGIPLWNTSTVEVL